MPQAHTRSGAIDDLRRHYPTFKIRSPRPKVKGGDKMDRSKSPLRSLKLLWDARVVSAFLNAMSKAKKQKSPNRACKDWTTVDFWSFLELTICFGVVRCPQRSMPWGDGLLLLRQPLIFDWLAQ